MTAITDEQILEVAERFFGKQHPDTFARDLPFVRAILALTAPAPAVPSTGEREFTDDSACELAAPSHSAPSEPTDEQIDAIDLRAVPNFTGSDWLRAFARAVLALRAPIPDVKAAEPVAVTTTAQIAAMQNGYSRSLVARDPVFAAMSPREHDVPLYAAAPIKPEPRQAPSDAPSFAADGKTPVYNFPGHPLMVRAVDFNAAITEPAPTIDAAFEAGWRIAAEWASREDLFQDIGSPRYLFDKKIALRVSIPDVKAAEPCKYFAHAVALLGSDGRGIYRVHAGYQYEVECIAKQWETQFEVTRYTNSPLDGLLSAAARMIQALIGVSQKAGKRDTSLGFVIEGGILRYTDGGCHPATDTELAMWEALQRRVKSGGAV